VECEIRLPKNFDSTQRNFQLDNDLSQRLRHFGFACHELPYFDKVGASDSMAQARVFFIFQQPNKTLGLLKPLDE